MTLPKGGGALRGIDEKFAANPLTGIGSLSVPIATSHGRSGFGPAHSLSYDSGSGIGAFALGWSLGLPAIGRRTDLELPTYNDDYDNFVLSRAEDLVPAFTNGTTTIIKATRDGYVIRRYRPRVEGLFARIERWSSISDPSDVHWRSISPDSTTTLYGQDAGSRISDPAKPTRIFQWLISASYDCWGGAIIYEYKSENSQGVPFQDKHWK